MRRHIVVLALGCGIAALATASGPHAALREATLVTVTTASDLMNGDVSTVAGLAADPGPDGLSLPEAIMATNNEPGQYDIRFDRALAGKTITVSHGKLPPLTGGGVSINGDTTGDGKPDVTLKTPRGANRAQWGLAIASSGNTVKGIRLRDFASGVFLMPSTGRTTPSNHTYEKNEITRLVMTGVQIGVSIDPLAGQHTDCEKRACPTHNRWLDTRIVGNTIASHFGGIELHLYGTIGDLMQRLTIAGNTLQLATAGGEFTSGFGISLNAGASGDHGGGSDRNRIADALISGNTITGNTQGGIRLAAADFGADANTLERIRVVGNRIHLRPPVTAGEPPRIGVTVSVADSCVKVPTPRALGCPEHNLARDIEITGNTLEEGGGVMVYAGVHGATDNAVRNVRIRRNRIVVRLPANCPCMPQDFPGIRVIAGISSSDQNGGGRQTIHNRIHDVTIAGSRIESAGAARVPAGVLLLGGWKKGATGNSLTCIHLNGNTILGVGQTVQLAQGTEGAAGNTASLQGC